MVAVLNRGNQLTRNTFTEALLKCNTTKMINYQIPINWYTKLKMIIWTSIMSKIDFFFSLLAGLTSSLWRWSTAAPAVCARSPPPSSQCTDVPWDTTGSCRMRKQKQIHISSTRHSSHKTLKDRFFFRFYPHDHTAGAIIAISSTVPNFMISICWIPLPPRGLTWGRHCGCVCRQSGWQTHRPR